MNALAQRRNQLIALLVIGVLVAAGVVYWATNRTEAYEFKGGEISPAAAAPPLELTDQNGEPFTLAQEEGKVSLIYFGYTTCPDLCPTTLIDFATVKEDLGEDARDVDFIMVTFDPERDTEARMQEYMTFFDPEFIGLRGADHLGLHNADLTVTYSPETNLPEDERWHVGTNYSYGEWDLGLTYNYADFYDLFGPTKTSRRGYSASLERTKNLIYDDPRNMELNLGIAGYWDLERLPDYQNIATSFDEFYSVWGDLSYENLDASLGAVEQEKGIRWTLSPSGTYVREEFYPAVVATLDGGVPLPLHHSSVWLRTAAGMAEDLKDDPFANFYFGGFGNNWVDHGKVKRYRDWYSFPGLELNEIGGTNFAKAVFEWNLPPLRFRRLGVPAFYASWARVSAFASALATNLDDDTLRREVGNIGAQLDIQMQFLSNLRLTLSFGYARAVEKDQRGSDEGMVSVKIL